MKELMKSASRIGMLRAMLVLGISFLVVVLYNVSMEAVVIGVISMFSSLISGITTYYYMKKQTNELVDKQL